MKVTSKNGVKPVKVIYNPKAGKKRQLWSRAPVIALEDIKNLLEQYQITAEYYPTKQAGHATILAQEAKREGYATVIAAGGDGTISEVANGLINSDVYLGILPLGSYMNIPRMLSIPNDLEKAVCLLKIGRTRKIDVGIIRATGEDKLNDSKDKTVRFSYFLENSSIGLEAQLQQNVLEWEKGNKRAILYFLKTIVEYYARRVKITLDEGKVIETRATMVAISNGPYTGAALQLAPKAKLNDHLLTISVFRMSKFKFLLYLLQLMRSGKTSAKQINTYQSKNVRVETRLPRLVHADASVFGYTPVEYEIIPNALTVISGFPTPEETALVKRTPLDP